MNPTNPTIRETPFPRKARYALYEMTSSGYILQWTCDFKGNQLMTLEQAQETLQRVYGDNPNWGIERVN